MATLEQFAQERAPRRLTIFEFLWGRPASKFAPQPRRANPAVRSSPTFVTLHALNISSLDDRSWQPPTSLSTSGTSTRDPQAHHRRMSLLIDVQFRPHGPLRPRIPRCAQAIAPPVLESQVELLTSRQPEFDFRVVGDGRSAVARYANNSNYRNDSLIRKEST